MSCLFPLEILSNFNVFWCPDRGGGQKKSRRMNCLEVNIHRVEMDNETSSKNIACINIKTKNEACFA